MTVNVGPSFARVRPEDIGWVLGNAREHARDRRLRTAAGFARGGPHVAVHRSQVGRWESGHTPASYDVVRRYEETLGLQAGHLAVVVDFMARRLEPWRSAPALARPLSRTWAADTIELVEKAVSDDRMSGLDWDLLSAHLAAHPDALLRGPDWERLLSRLVLEIATTTDLEYSLRAEAAARIAGHPRSGPHVTELARRSLADPTTQIFEAVTLVPYSVDPSNADMLTAAVADPGAREPARWATLMALTSLAEAGRLEMRHRARAGAVALDLLRDESLPLRTHRSAATFLAAIDPPTRAQIAAALRARSRRRIARIVEEGTALDAAEVAAIASRIERRLIESLGPSSRWAPQLQELVRTATSASHLEPRGMALEVLKLTPQGPVIGAAYAAEVRDLALRDQPVLVDDTLARLSWVLQPDDVPALLTLALDRSVDPVTAQQAAMAIGNSRPPAGERVGGMVPREAPMTADDVAARVMASARRHLTEPSIDVDAPRGHLYILGMYGRFDLLEALAPRVAAASGPAAGCWADALTWWRQLPPWARPSA